MSKSNNLTPAAKDKKIKLIILVVTLCLSVTFILTSILLAAFRNNDYDNHNYNNNNYRSVSGSLYIGGNSIYIGSSSNGVYYSFMPSSSGWYRFYSSNSSSGLDPRAVLYDSNWNQLASNDDGAANYNFNLSYNLYYGYTYYLQIISCNNNSGSTTVYIQNN